MPHRIARGLDTRVGLINQALAAATIAACLLPALRAARVDPMAVLRNE